MRPRNSWIGVRSATALFAGVALTLGGCSSSAPAGDEANTITVVGANTPWWAALKDKVSEFTKETGIKVNLSEFGESQLADQLQVKLNAKASDIDVIALRPAQDMRLYVENGWLADLSGLSKDPATEWSDVYPTSRDAVTYDGSVWGLPVMTEREIVYYNSTLLKAAGVQVPKTLDELEAAARKINDPGKGIAGIAMRGAANPAVTQFCGFLYSFGGTWQKNDGSSAISSPEAIKAYDYYGRLLREYGPPGVSTMGWPEASAIFAQGKAGFYIDADSQAHVFEDPASSKVVDSFGYAPFPAGPAGAKPYNTTPWAVGVNAYSTKQELANKFILWATGSEFMKAAMTAKQNQSPRASTWQDASATANFPPELIKIVEDYATTAVPFDRPRVIQVSQARDIVGAPINASLQGQDVAAAAADASAKFDAFLKTDK